MPNGADSQPPDSSTTDPTTTDPTTTDPTNADDTTTTVPPIVSDVPDDTTTTVPAIVSDVPDDTTTTVPAIVSDVPDDTTTTVPAIVIDVPDDEAEVIEVDVPPIDLLHFIFLGWQARPDEAPASDPSSPAPEGPLRTAVDDYVNGADNLASVLLDPPEEFSNQSRQLAEEISELLDNSEFLGKIIVVGVFVNIASDNPAEILAKGDYDVSDVADALLRMPSITVSAVREAVELALVKGTLSPDEAKFWTAVDTRLGQLQFGP